MEDINYDFVDLDDNESFELLGKSFGGIVRDNSFYFDNNFVSGEIIRAAPDEGLWIRKWKLTTFQKITLHKLPTLNGSEKKFLLIYFLNPAIFFLNACSKKIKIYGSRNNILLTSEMKIDFSVIPKQPFYVLDIAFTRSWLSKEFHDVDPSFKNILKHLSVNAQATLAQPCSVEEYKTLHELEIADSEDVLFTRSRVYNLIFSFLNKIINRAEVIRGNLHYEQIMQVETMIKENLKELPKLESIARKVNMSVSSLLRQFKLIHGKGIYEYYVAKKMEFAKKMILENKITIRELSEKLGYKQASAFIESFTKHVGYSPGSLKHLFN